MFAQNLTHGFVAIASSQAGSCLTMANWAEAGVQALAWRLDELLMKPGREVLSRFASLRAYTAWTGLCVLNASLPKPNREGVYTIASQYDGARIRLDTRELFDLIVALQPDRVVLPMNRSSDQEGLWQSLPSSIHVYWPTDTGLCDSDPEQPGYGHYFQGEYDVQNDSRLQTMLVESDRPAQDAVCGRVYYRDGVLAIDDAAMAHEHQPIDSECPCPTCRQGLTRAYLHHLLQHTPLLAQRFLVQHNACNSRL